MLPTFLSHPPLPVLPPASPLAVGITDRFLRQDAPELARRIVAELDQPIQLATAMGLTAVQWNVLEHHPHFQSLMAEARSEASSATGLADRVRLKALMALDQGGVLDMVSVMANSDTSDINRIKAFDALSDVAGLTKTKDAQAQQVGSGPLVTIIMPSNTPPVQARVVSEQ